jgi:hypothetical protein
MLTLTLFQLQRLLLQALNETVRLSWMLFTDSEQISVDFFQGTNPAFAQRQRKSKRDLSQVNL